MVMDIIDKILNFDSNEIEKQLMLSRIDELKEVKSNLACFLDMTRNELKSRGDLVNNEYEDSFGNPIGDIVNLE